ncbi:MAG: tRNA (adenosine(37)-N6)-threonylcarbamoyltransferase complex ATPase subunit type 1 TsaE [Alphaproteobacteria bacterium]|nr:tRNA (adenosine(37)-N6)-threonylcarbamoyltransferase complex ATPase subunit type 1 TsaE [Alphaproteobacteria bacterium]
MASESITIELPDEAATGRLAAAVATQARVGDVIALAGGLGAGKTSFARAFIRARAGDPALDVPSPTFTLVQTYDLPGGPVWHFDLYRLKRADEAWELGIEDAFAEAISLIEWPERLGDLLPAEHLEIALAAAADPMARQARLTPSASWRDRIEGIDRHA